MELLLVHHHDGLITNEELAMIVESMDLLWGQTSDRLRVEEGGGDGSKRVDHRDQTIAGL